jgi:Lyase
MSQFRTERDTFGNIEVPAERLWGAQTQRSLQNFRISGERMPIALIHALATVKRAAAQVNRDLKVLDTTKADAIIKAADEVIAGKHDEEFPLVVWQRELEQVAWAAQRFRSRARAARLPVCTLTGGTKAALLRFHRKMRRKSCPSD